MSQHRKEAKSSMCCLSPSSRNQATIVTSHTAMLATLESQSKRGTKMVYPEPCKELRRRPQLFVVGIILDLPGF